MNVQQQEKSGREAIEKLRLKKLKNGEPFMINTNMLPSNQCYLQYSNGLVSLVQLSRKESDLKTIATYSKEESSQILKQFYIV